MMCSRLIPGVVVAMVSSCGFAQIACSARTPQQALPSGSVAAAHESASLSSSNSYRLARIVVDPELHRRWALVANCTHPERPLEIVPLSAGHMVVPTPTAQPVPSAPRILGETHPGTHTEVVRHAATAAVMGPKTSTPDASVRAPVIHAGDLVRLWSSGGNVRLEMAVVSLEYGRIGQIIHVRRMGQSALLAGVVVGKDSAELVP